MTRFLVWLFDGMHFITFGDTQLSLSLVRAKWEKRDAWVGLFWDWTEYDGGLSVYFCPIPFRVYEMHFEPCEHETEDSRG